MPNHPDWNQIMGALVKAIALEVAAELRPAIAQAAREAIAACAPLPARARKWPAMLNVRQLAEYIGVPYQTVRNWRLNKQIPIKAHNPPGSRTVRYDRREVDAWWAAQKEP